MRLKPTLTAEEHEKIESEDIKGLYSKGDDGSYALDLDGKTAGEKAALDARDTERKKVEAATGELAKFKGIDPEEYKRRGERITELEAAGKSKDEGKKSVEDRLAEMEANFTAKLKEETEARQKAEAATVQMRKIGQFRDAAAAAGVKAGLTTDMLWGALSGQAKTAENGDLLIGDKPVGDHMEALRKSDGHLFEASKGAGIGRPGGPPPSNGNGLGDLVYSEDTHDAFQKAALEDPKALEAYTKAKAKELGL